MPITNLIISFEDIIWADMQCFSPDVCMMLHIQRTLVSINFKVVCAQTWSTSRSLCIHVTVEMVGANINFFQFRDEGITKKLKEKPQKDGYDN